MKKWFISICCGLCVLLAACGADADFLLQNEDVIVGEASAEDATCSDNDSADAKPTSGKICVYICGAVKVPGVYEMAPGSRLYELVELAGGLSEAACEGEVNLAQPVEDGQMIRIPTEEETDAAAQNTAGSAKRSADGRVNINTADTAQLTALNGIGETKAASIIAYREKYGSFQHIEDIMKVDGIAKGTYEKIYNMITVQ